jgi:general L-amino acid transport system substrate-binding protein
LDEAGNFSGFDVDCCRAVAAAVFGDATKFEIRPATAAERFTVLQTGEGDVLFRNTTWTMSRDTDLGANFAPITFYDGQGMMVRKDEGITTLEDLAGGSICVQTGTTTELNLADQMAALGIDYEPVVFETVDETFTAYEEGRCDAVTTDKSGLVSRQSVLAEPDAHTVLDATLSKEPLAPMVRQGDDQWFDIINWVVFTTILAEEHGITSANVDEFVSSENPDIRRLLGQEGEFGQKVGLSNDWGYNVIKQVGNYGEIYNRNLGPDTVFNLPRGLNQLYTEGGLLYAPPIR